MGSSTKKDYDLAIVGWALPTLTNIALFNLNSGIVRFYQGQGNYATALSWCEQNVTLLKSRLGDHHPDVATSLNNLARLYHNQGRYTEAEPLYKQALALNKELLGDRLKNCQKLEGLLRINNNDNHSCRVGGEDGNTVLPPRG